MAQPLVELRCGKLVRDGTILKADPRKGMVRVVMDDQDLIHFQWAERTATGTTLEPESDQIIFAGEASFEKARYYLIDRPGSRVFTLKFPSEPDRDLFFWAQEPQADSDTQFVNAVNAALTSVLDGMDADTDVAMSEDPRDPSATPAAGAPPPTSDNIGGIGASALAAALGNILTGGTAGTGPSQGMPQLSYPSLGEVLKADRIAPLLQNPSLVARLAPYLPEEHRSTEAMAQIIHSPQFKHQLEVLTQALATGQIDTSQFGLGPPAFGVAEFLNAIQRQADQEGAASRGTEETEKKDEGQ